MGIPDVKIIITGLDKFSSQIGKPLKAINKLGKSVSAVGKQMTIGLTLPIAAFGFSTLKTAGQYEMSMNKVQNLTKATMGEFTELKNVAREMGAETIFSASEAADAMSFLGMAGLDTEQIIGTLPSTLNLAAAGQLELAESADFLSNIMTAYGKDAKEANTVTDQMVFTANNANTNIRQFAEAMKFTATVAKGLDVPFHETSAAIGMLGNAGIQASMAGTTMRMSLSRLAKPTSEAIKVLNRLGISKDMVQDSMGNLKSLGNIIAAFEKQGARTADVMSIFGQRAGPGMAALISQGSKEFKKFSEEIRLASGTAQESADVMTKGLNGQLKMLKSAFEELQLAIADSGLLKFITKGVEKITGFIRKISKLNPKILKFGTIILGVVAAIGPLLMVLGTALIFISKFAGAISAAGGIIALISNPVGWVIAGITALIGIITYMVTHTESKLTKVLTYFFPLAGVMAWVIKRWKRILPFIKLFVFAIIGLMKLLYKLLKPVITPIIELLAWLGDMVTKTLDMVLSGVEKLASLALPDWLEKKIGLETTHITKSPAGLIPPAPVSGEFKSESKATLTIKNAPPGSTVDVEEGDMGIDMESGLIPVGVSG